MKMADNSVGTHESTLKNYTIDDLRSSMDAWIRFARCTEPKLEPMYYHHVENRVINPIATRLGGAEVIN